MHRDVKPHNVMIDHQQKKVPLQSGNNKPFIGRLRADNTLAGTKVVSGDRSQFLWQTGDADTPPVSSVGFYFA